MSYRPPDASTTVSASTATTTLDASTVNRWQVTLAANTTIDVSNIRVGLDYWIEIIQDGTGGRTCAFDSKFKFTNGLTPQIFDVASAVTLISFFAADASHFIAQATMDYTDEVGVYSSPGATLNMDGGRYQKFYCTLDATTVIDLINPKIGKLYIAALRSSNTYVPRTITWGTNFVFSGGYMTTTVSGNNTPTLYAIYVVSLTKFVASVIGDFRAGMSMTGTLAMTLAVINEAQGADILSATTTSIGSSTGNYIVVTGTTTITGLGNIQAGTRRIVEFSGALILTHNATSLILPGGANITTAAGDVAVFVSEGSGNWRCTGYMFAASLPLLRTGGTLSGRLLVPNIEETQSALTYSTTPVIDFTGDAVKIITMTGDISSMTTSNRAAGRKVTVILDPNGSARAITAFNSSWRNFSGAALPTTLASGKYFIFTLQCTDTAETGVLIAGQTQQ